MGRQTDLRIPLKNKFANVRCKCEGIFELTLSITDKIYEDSRMEAVAGIVLC
jgi:hypothetical protein